MRNSRSRGNAYPVTPKSPKTPRAPDAPADPVSISKPSDVSSGTDDLLAPAVAPTADDAPAADPAEPAAVPVEDPEAAAQNSDFDELLELEDALN